MDKNFINRVIDNVAENDYVENSALNTKDFPQEYIEKMIVLGEKYREVRWLPLDIPKLEFDDLEEFKDLWDKESADVLRVKPDVAEPWSREEHPLKELSSWNLETFKGLTLYNHPTLSPESGTSFSRKLYEGNNRQLKRILEQVFEYYPIHTMLSVFIWQSTRQVLPHRDKTFFWKCPTEFRVMLHDENDKPTLYVADIEHRDMHYIDCPEDTNSFCWSNGTQFHGSDYYGKRKWILCMSGVQHSSKSDELFERSIKKYKDKLNYKLNIDI